MQIRRQNSELFISLHQFLKLHTYNKAVPTRLKLLPYAKTETFGREIVIRPFKSFLLNQVEETARNYMNLVHQEKTNLNFTIRVNKKTKG